jgi:hypothetical protein
MEGIRLRSGSEVFFGAGNIEIDNDGFLPAAHDYSFDRLVFFRVEFLVRDIGRNIDEVSRPGFVDELQALSPAEAGAAANNVDDSFQFAVVMRTSLGVGMDEHRSGPEFLGADTSAGDRFSAGHAGGLGSVGIEFPAANDSQAVEFPVGFIIGFGGHWFLHAYDAGGVVLDRF